MGKIWKRILKSKFTKWYALLIALILVISTISFVLVYNILYSSDLDNRRLQLEGSVNRVDDYISALNSSGTNLLYHPETINLMTKNTLDVNEYVELNKFRKLLDTTSFTNSNIVNYYMVFSKSDIVFDKYRIYMSVHELYGQFDQIDNWSEDKFINELINGDEKYYSALKLHSSNKEYDVLPIKITTANSENCSIVALMSIDDLKQMIGIELNSENKISVKMQDKVLYDDGVSKIIKNNGVGDGDKYTIINVKSNTLGLEYDIAVNNNSINSMMTEIILKYATIFGIMAIVGCLIFIFLEIMLNKNFIQLSKQYDDQKPFLTNYHFNRLLETLASNKEISEAVRHFGIDETKKAYSCVLRDQSSKKLENWQSALYKLIIQSLNTTSILNKLDSNDDLILILYNELGDDNSSWIILDAIKKFNAEKGTDIIIGIGERYTGTRGISVSYYESKKVVDYKETHSNFDVEYYHDLPTAQEIVVLDVDEKNKIYQFIVSNEPERASAIFKQIFNDKCRNSYILNPLATNNFIAQSTSILIQSIRESVWDKEKRKELLISVSKLFNIPSPDSFLIAYTYIIEKICSCIINKEDKGKAQIEKLLEYISTNYNDCDLSLSKLGDIFGMNESYVSQFFKQATGNNFSQYLENLRMTNAARLIENTDNTINQIVDLVGYANRNTFYKAFLRVYGVSPRAYKENIVNKILDDK